MVGGTPGNPDGRGNVHALFPGIDTTPFGTTEPPGRVEVNDDGWSATPERTISDHDHHAVLRPAGRHFTQAISPRRAIAALACAALIGAGIGTGHALMAHSTSKHVSTATAQIQSTTAASDGPGATAPFHRPLHRAVPVHGVSHAPAHVRRRRQGARKRVNRSRHAKTTRSESGQPHTAAVSPVTQTVIETETAPAPAASDPAPSSGSSPSGGSTHPSTGSTHRPAFGSNGVLGPGSSPDS